MFGFVRQTRRACTTASLFCCCCRLLLLLLLSDLRRFLWIRSVDINPYLFSFLPFLSKSSPVSSLTMAHRYAQGNTRVLVSVRGPSEVTIRNEHAERVRRYRFRPRLLPILLVHPHTTRPPYPSSPLLRSQTRPNMPIVGAPPLQQRAPSI